MANLKVVEVIDLSSNQLSSDIPTSIGGLQHLSTLSISSNRLQGHIPQSVGDLVSLERLDLSSNNLTGMIPKSLEKLLLFKNFNVSFNRLQGENLNGGPFVNFSARSFMGNEALCGSTRMLVPQCQRSNPQPSKKSRMIVLRYILATTASIILIVAFVIIPIRHHKHNAKLPSLGDLQPLATWRRISRHELKVAAYGFQDSNLLGSGSFDSVYKGTLSDGMTVEVKVFNMQLEGAFSSFDVECEVLRNLRH
ncbi:receptor kinase-like protein Xa21 [Ricinus communis]|uniref:receptor kinase-like protein Xa21 n=1 Tax=Ricinus communis TaxID=3988 RepID=UPI00201ADEEB|nr:receptor kinase-like protein Xa21 [Ricinus communis]